MKTLFFAVITALLCPVIWLFAGSGSLVENPQAGDLEQQAADLPRETTESPSAPKVAVPTAISPVSHPIVLSLFSRDSSIVDAAIEKIDEGWHPGLTVMLVETLRFVRDPSSIKKTNRLLHRKTGENFGTDFNSWYRWIWKRPYRPHPEYAAFKARLYSRIDRRFSAYFRETDNARIRLDEIRWGGVKRDGIPPLKNPHMILAKDAGYLADTDVVFGVNLNGDARCYPKRILAWHEMFKDTIGGIPVCGAY